ncbi:MAG: hypothetical protein ACI8T1_002563 [Verrucomicrobiales bacterium]
MVLKLTDDIKSSKWLLIKGGLFLFIGILGAVLLWLQQPTFLTAALLGIVIWAFASVYYFMFYVVTHYIDGEYRFSGIISFLRWWRQRR